MTTPVAAAVPQKSGMNTKVHTSIEIPTLRLPLTSGKRFKYQKDAQLANQRIDPMKAIVHGFRVSSRAPIPSHGDTADKTTIPIATGASFCVVDTVRFYTNPCESTE